MLIAVTGASGFVGGSVAAWLRRRGHIVLAYGRRSAELVRGSASGYTSWDITRGPIDGPPVDAVVHCAAMVDDWGDESAFHAVNVCGTRAVAESFPEARRFVHISTASVYDGELPLLRVREDAPYASRYDSAYARSKMESEMVLRELRRPIIILRPHIVYGPGDTTLLPRVVAARLLGRLPLAGTGRNRLSVTHVANLAHAVERALTGRVDTGIFNVADASDVTLDELVRTLFRRTGVRDRIVYVPYGLAMGAATCGEAAARLAGWRRPFVVTRYVVRQLAFDFTLDLTRARAMLGYDPRWSIRDGPLGGGEGV